MKTKNWILNNIARSLACLVLFTGAANSYAQVTVSGAVSGNGTYATLGAAFTAIGTAQASANIIIDITANTTEAAGGAVLGAGNWSTLTIRPSGGGARTITGAVTAGSPLIDFNGADNVTINGLNTGGNSLTISNTTASATSGTSTIQLRADAVSNTITNCTILGSGSMAVGTNGGNIFFSTGTTTGNDNNTVSNCNIGPAGSNLATKGIYMNGSTTTTAIGNSGNTFTGNNIFDYFGAAVASAGVYIGGGNTDNNITNNKFYQTAARTHTSSSQHSAIWITNTGNNFQVTGNTIGYASASATGVYTFTGVSGSYMIPIFISVGTTTATVVSTNTITAMAVSGAMNGTSSTSAFRLIYISSGLATCNDNIIGSQTATGAITYTSSSTVTSDISVIYNFGSSNWTTNNNVIGGITASNSSTGASNIYAIRCNTGSSVTWTCNNNTIGGTVANSISSTSTATGTLINGILNSNPIGTFTGNVIRNMTVAGGTGTTTSASMSGIVINAGSANHTLSQNSIYNLSNTNTGASGVVVNGIYCASSTGTNIIERNLVHSLSAATSAVSNVNGIYMSSGTVTFQNNMIRLGIDGSGSITAGHVFYGFNLAGGTNTVYHNSVYIGGTGVGGSGSTYGLYNATTNTRNFRNNIFVNERSNGAGTGKHYAIRETSTTGLTINYNIYVASGTGGVLGSLTSDRANLAAWQTATSQDANSLSSAPGFINATGATPDLHINTSIASPADMTGIAIATVTNDFDNDTRSGLTPTDIGADAFNGASPPCAAPTTQPTALTFTGVTGTALSGSFTAASPAADNYIVVRSTSSTLSATPSNTTTYSVGNSLGGGTVVMVGSGTSFGESGLTPATTYYYFVFAYNSLCSGGPTYNATSPLTNNATTCLPAPTSSAATAVTLTGFTANWSSVASATGYVLDVSTSNTFATFVSGYNALAVGNVTSYAVTGLTSGTTYYYRVRATGSICTSINSSNQSVVVGYCSSTASGTTNYITSFSTTGGATNITNTGSGLSAGGYGDFTSQSASQSPTLTVNFSTTFSSGSFGFAIFIDWNNDLDFVDAGETVFTSGSSYVTSSSGSFTVPASQAVGTYRMRIVANYNSTTPVPCNSMTSGETEDYTFNVVALPTCSGTPTAGTAVASVTNICSSGTTSLSLTGSTSGVAGLTYQWQSSPDGSTYANIASATATTYTSGTITSTTYYRCVVTCTSGGASANSTPVTVNVNTPSIVSTVPGSRCGTGTVTLQATGSASTTLKWYAASSGGTALGTGTSFVTPSISTNTNYYVEAVSAGSTPVSVGLINPAAGGTQGDQTTGWDINFTVLSATTLQTIDIYPVASGQSGTFTVRSGTGFSGTVLATVNYTTTVSGGATVQTLTFNTPLAAGTYSVYADVLPTSGLRRNTAGASYPYTSSVANITGNGYSSSYYMGCYNWVFGSVCASSRTMVTATVNAAPAFATSGSQNTCAGSGATVTVTTGAADYDTYSWTPSTGVTGNSVSGWTITPSATTAYTLNVSQSTGSLCTNSTAVTITVKPVPTANAGSNTSICPGGSATLAGSGTFAGTTTLYSNDFSSVTGWTSNDYNAWGTWISSDAGGVSPELGMEWYSGTSGVLNIWAQSPLIDLTSYTQYSAMTLSFKTIVDWYSNNFNIYVETSPDGTTWTQRWTTNVTADIAASTVSMNLTPLIGQAFYVRFRYNAQLIRINYWGIDDMLITGTPTMTYAWTPSGTLSASNVAGPVATPTSATTYTLVTSVGGCNSTPSNVTVAVNTATPANIATATGATLAAGDMLWNGYSSTVWSTASNWYEYNGSAFAVSTNVPTTTTRVFVLPSNTTNACISGSNNTTVSAGGDANNVFIGTGATLLVNAGQTLNVTGNWTNNGTFTPNVTGVVNFTGGNNQSIGGSSANAFTNMTVNKSGNAITLSAPASVSSTLTMTSGTINTTAVNLLTVGTSAASPGTLDWTAGTVIGPLKRFMSGTASSTQASGIFPVGNASWNRYAQVNYNSDPGTGGFIVAEYKSGVCPIGITGLPATINGMLVTNYENEGYWEITPTGGNLNTTPYDLVLRGNHLSTVTDVNQLRIIKSSGHSAWNDNVAGDGNHVAASGSVTDFTIGAAGMLGFSWFDIGSDDINPLPVTLTSFSANCGDGVELKWSTASEQNSQLFVVERSRDLSSWSHVSTQIAAGNSNYNINYAAVDHHAFGGTSYYRLVQVDNDGVEKVFGPISVSCGELQNSMIVFPNPTNGAFTVQISSVSDISNADVMVLDLTGKVVATHILTIHEGNNQLMFDHMDLKKGTYIVNVVSESEFTPVRVVVN